MYFRYVPAVRRFAGLLFLRIQSGEKQNKVYSDITATNSSLNQFLIFFLQLWML